MDNSSRNKLDHQHRKKRRRQGRDNSDNSSNNDHQKDPSSSEHEALPSPVLPFGNCVGVSQRFRKVCRVGEGTYGVVYKAEDRRNKGDFVALKRCIPHHQSSDGFNVTALREIQSLRMLQHHPHVISLRTDISMVAVSKNDIFLVFEYAEHDLAQILDHHYQKVRSRAACKKNSNNNNNKSPFRESHVKTLIQQLLSALECIHENRLIHRDLKVSNLLYTDTGNLKLADFGLSRSLPAGSLESVERGGYLLTPNVVSLWYRPPELLLGSKRYSQAIDMWGCGCIFAELLQGFPLWMCKTELEQLETIFTNLGQPSAETWPSVIHMPLIQQGAVSLGQYHQKRQQQIKNQKISTMPLLDTFSYLSTSGLMLLTHLLHYDANHQRLTAAQALKSSYFTSEPMPSPSSAMPKFRSLHTAISKK